MGPILNLLIAPAATYFVSMLINFIRGAAVSDKAMILIVGGISAGVTATEALTGYVSADTTNMIANFLAGLASTFFHQLYTKVKEPAAS